MPDEGKTKRSAAVVASVAVAANVHEMTDDEGLGHPPGSAADRAERKPSSNDTKEEENLKGNPLITPVRKLIYRLRKNDHRPICSCFTGFADSHGRKNRTQK